MTRLSKDSPWMAVFKKAVAPKKNVSAIRTFTLIELLVVIAIIGIR
ncbi:MAG: prepilin-type N-terminal cleavage/methylation domain-containing protein [Lentisphaeria bacterium]|nr:prepilin-type N-terminal cleavage/methylation domain-containing protein [Lentisphaeria bacterium]